MTAWPDVSALRHAAASTAPVRSAPTASAPAPAMGATPFDSLLGMALQGSGSRPGVPAHEAELPIREQPRQAERQIMPHKEKPLQKARRNTPEREPETSCPATAAGSEQKTTARADTAPADHRPDSAERGGSAGESADSPAALEGDGEKVTLEETADGVAGQPQAVAVPEEAVRLAPGLLPWQALQGQAEDPVAEVAAAPDGRVEVDRMSFFSWRQEDAPAGGEVDWMTMVTGKPPVGEAVDFRNALSSMPALPEAVAAPGMVRGPVFSGNTDTTESALLKLDGAGALSGQERLAALASAKPVAARSPVFGAELAEQIGKMRVVSRPGGVEQVRIILDPKDLGELEVNVRMDRKGVINVTIVAETEAAREAINRNMAQLRDAMSRQQLHFGEVNVQVGTQDRRDPGAGGADREAWSGLQARSDADTDKHVAAAEPAGVTGRPRRMVPGEGLSLMA
ncbi:MAG: flagellar hook-length control protein FliK [Magnetococcales bacterium]|nr:flagellar hook-length control protein FliK [Magnetococcales bacterium]